MTTPIEPHVDLQRLIERLRRLTEEQRYIWQTFTADGYALSLARGTVEIESADADGGLPFIFRVRDTEGAVTDQISTEHFTSSQSWVQNLIRLHRAAKRTTASASPVVSALLEELPEPEVHY